MDQSIEVWRPVDGQPGYEVSSHGRVRSLDRWIEQGNKWGTKTRYFKKGRILRACGSPYRHVLFSFRGRCRQVHALVAQAFLPPCPGVRGRERGHWNIDHIDGDTFNNHASNLQWLPRRTNSYVKSGLRHDKAGRFAPAL
jgi:hypothetical protein